MKKIAVLTAQKHDYKMLIEQIDPEDREQFLMISDLNELKREEISAVIRLRSFVLIHDAPLELLANAYMGIEP